MLPSASTWTQCGAADHKGTIDWVQQGESLWGVVQIPWPCDIMLLVNGTNGEKAFFFPPKMKMGFCIIYLMLQSFECPCVGSWFWTLSCCTASLTSQPNHCRTCHTTCVRVNCWTSGVRCMWGVFSCLPGDDIIAGAHALWSFKSRQGSGHSVCPQFSQRNAGAGIKGCSGIH